MRASLPHTRGFTIIELMVVLVIIGILGALVALAYSGVQAKNRNSDRQVAINNLQAELETYYAKQTKYPTLDNMNDAAWRDKNMPELKAATLQDPRWENDNQNCAIDKKPTLAGKPVANCYSYQVTAADGSPCDNAKATCAHYTLTSLFEGGENYVKSSLN